MKLRRIILMIDDSDWCQKSGLYKKVELIGFW